MKKIICNFFDITSSNFIFILFFQYYQLIQFFIRNPHSHTHTHTRISYVFFLRVKLRFLTFGRKEGSNTKKVLTSWRKKKFKFSFFVFFQDNDGRNPTLKKFQVFIFLKFYPKSKTFRITRTYVFF